ncbi:hypothetical protein Bbelb_203070 [Branchiostoma belcheri]|nr:hypothetical protein Bbelb_203070 [Branchiostoma belcheri]
MAARGSRYGRRLVSSFLTVSLQTETGGANSRTAQGQAQGQYGTAWGRGVQYGNSRTAQGQAQGQYGQRGIVREQQNGPGATVVVVAARETPPGLVSLCPEECPRLAGGDTRDGVPAEVLATAAELTRSSRVPKDALLRHSRPLPWHGYPVPWHNEPVRWHRGPLPQQSRSHSQTSHPNFSHIQKGPLPHTWRYRDLTLFQRFKYMVKDYGHVLIPVHVATSLVWFGCFYYMAISGVDPVPLLEKIGLPHSWVETMKKSGASDVMVAYAFYKIATPARYTVTLGGTTFTIRYLRKKGVMQKPPPSKHMEKMKDFIQEKRDQLKNK